LGALPLCVFLLVCFLSVQTSCSCPVGRKLRSILSIKIS
jgi:hypothetical protein